MIPLRDLNPSRRVPFVTVTLILVNALLFLYELSLGPQGLQVFLFQNAFIPDRFFGGPEVGGGLAYGASSSLLSMFLHGGWSHFLGNMLFLWIFGDNIEDRLGHVRFVIFYLAAGYAATAAHAVASKASVVPAIGASGAISGVLGAYLLLYPRARVVTLVFLGFFIQLVEVPAIVYLPLWFAIQFFSGVASLAVETNVQAGGVAWFAHIGGFVAGPVLLFLLGGWGRDEDDRRPPPRRAEPRVLRRRSRGRFPNL